MNHVYLLIGGNIGDRIFHLQKAREEIVTHIGQISSVSSIYQTAPWGNNDQPDFLNQVLLVNTNLDPFQLLNQTLSIEKQMGRVRDGLNKPRIIDIDILYYNEEKIETAELIIPHPRIHVRRFVLIPMNEINPSYIDPFHQKTIADLLSECKDELEVKAYQIEKEFLFKKV